MNSCSFNSAELIQVFKVQTVTTPQTQIYLNLLLGLGWRETSLSTEGEGGHISLHSVVWLYLYIKKASTAQQCPMSAVPEATSRGPCPLRSSLTPSRNSRPPAFSRAVPRTGQQQVNNILGGLNKK